MFQGKGIKMRNVKLELSFGLGTWKVAGALREDCYVRWWKNEFETSNFITESNIEVSGFNGTVASNPHGDGD